MNALKRVPKGKILSFMEWLEQEFRQQSAKDFTKENNGLSFEITTETDFSGLRKTPIGSTNR